MFLARVVGRIWADQKNENYNNVPLLIVQPLNEELKDAGAAEVSADSMGCCEGEIVWVEGGKEAMYSLPNLYGPSDSSIVGKIDSLDVAVKPPKGRPVKVVGERGEPGGTFSGAPNGSASPDGSVLPKGKAS